jgi:manganese-dependent ADP-ribose/CDP-alcohol diphosphatase
MMSSGPNYHFVPYNGGVGQKQLQWISATLQFALGACENVIVFSHVPIGGSLPCVQSSACCLLNFEDVDREIRRVNSVSRARSGSNIVAAVISGHYHRGLYGCDSDGVHHLAVEAPLVHCNGAWGALQLLPDRIEVLGRGAMQSRTMVIGTVSSSTSAS